VRVQTESSWGLVLVSLSLVVFAGVGPGCKAQSSSPGTMAPAADEGAAADPLVELEQLEGQMRAYGLEPGTASVTTAGGDGDDGAEEAEASDAAMGAVSEDAGAAPAEAEPSAVAPPAQGQAARRETQQRCEDLCGLNVAICELEGSICSLAQDHGDDPTYADACERASEDCEISAEACDRCDA